MKTHEQILGSEIFAKLLPEFQKYNMFATHDSIKNGNGEIKFYDWLVITNPNLAQIIKIETIKDIEAQRIEMGCEDDED